MRDVGFRRVVRALRQQADTYEYAKSIAVALHEKHHKSAAPDWKPLPDLMGVLSQIDNMTVGLVSIEEDH